MYHYKYMPTAEQKKALDEGLLTKKQYDKLPSALLDGIIKSKRGGGKKKKRVQAPKSGGAGKSRNMGSTRKAKPSGPKNSTAGQKGKKGKK